MNDLKMSSVIILTADMIIGGGKLAEIKVSDMQSMYGNRGAVGRIRNGLQNCWAWNVQRTLQLDNVAGVYTAIKFG